MIWVYILLFSKNTYNYYGITSIFLLVEANLKRSTVHVAPVACLTPEVQKFTIFCSRFLAATKKMFWSFFATKNEKIAVVLVYGTTW